MLLKLLQHLLAHTLFTLLGSTFASLFIGVEAGWILIVMSAYYGWPTIILATIYSGWLTSSRK